MRTQSLALAAALLLGHLAMAQTPTDSPAPPKKAKDTSSQVQVTSNTGSKRHCRDTDVKAADGNRTAQTDMNSRIRRSQAECKQDAPKPTAPDSKDALKDSGNQSSVPSNDKG